MKISKSKEKTSMTGIQRTAKCEAKKREQGLNPRKYWVHTSNNEEFKRIAKAMEDPNVKVRIIKSKC